MPCRCRRNLYHKETKTTTENNITTINIVEDRSSFKVGRGITPNNNIFKPEENQLGSIAICDTGWGSRSTSRKITPEELDERMEKIEMDVEKIEEEVNEIKKNNFNTLD